MGNGYTPDDYDPGPYYTPAAWRPPPIPRRPPIPPQYRQVDPVGSLQPNPAATPPTPGAPPPPAPPGENINQPTPPAPDPLAGPDPKHPGWGSKPGYAPSLAPGPQVAAIPRPPLPPGVDPNRGYIFPPPSERPSVTPGTLTPPPQKQGDRYWNPVGQQQPFAEQINRYAHEYGVPPNLLSNLLRAESNFNPRATGPMTKYGQAEGIAQFIPQTAARYHINPYDPDQGIRGAANYLRDLYNQKGTWAGAVAAYNGAKSIDVSQYRGSPEGRALIANAAALDGGLVKAGPLVPPPQNYRPVSYTPRGGYPSMFPDRPPSMWGRDHPSMFEGPGAVPHQREIPGILGALAPFLMVGLALFSRGAALPMLSAFSGYQTAKNQRRDKDAEELKKHYQTQLAELKAKMGIEQVAYAGAQGDPQKLHDLAVEFGDDQLLNILANGGDPDKLFQARDKAFQDVSKTNQSERLEMERERLELTVEKSEAERKLHEAKDPLEIEKLKKDLDEKNAKLKQFERDRGAETAPYPEEGAPAPAEAPAEPPAEGAPAEGAAEAPAPAEGPAPAAPASGEAPAAPAPSEPAPAAPAPGRGAEAAPPPTGGEDQVVDAQGQPIPRRADVVPADYRGPVPQATPAAATSPTGAPATPSAAVPDVGVGGLGPSQYSREQLSAIGLSPERLDQDARRFIDIGQSALYHGGPSGDALANPRNEAVRRRAAQMQGYIDRVIADARANQGKKGYDPDSVFQRVEAADPGLANVARLVDRGDQPSPTSYASSRSQFNRNVVELIAAADPNFTAARYPLKYRTNIAFTVGQQGTQQASLNRVMQHMEVLLKTAGQLGNLGSTDVNAVKNWFNVHRGKPEVTEFRAALQAVGDEEEKAFRGTGGADAEIKRTLSNINENSSPAQIYGYVRTVAELLKGQMDGLAFLKGQGMNQNITGDMLLTPQAKQTYYDIINGVPLGNGEVPLPQNTSSRFELDPRAPYPPQPGEQPAAAAPADSGWTAQPEPEQ